MIQLLYILFIYIFFCDYAIVFLFCFFFFKDDLFGGNDMNNNNNNMNINMNNNNMNNNQQQNNNGEVLFKGIYDDGSGLFGIAINQAIEIYSEIIDDVTHNIICILLDNDLRQDIVIDVKNISFTSLTLTDILKDSETDFTKKDAAGNKILYRIIVKDKKIIAVLTRFGNEIKNKNNNNNNNNKSPKNVLNDCTNDIKNIQELISQQKQQINNNNNNNDFDYFFGGNNIIQTIIIRMTIIIKIIIIKIK